MSRTAVLVLGGPRRRGELTFHGSGEVGEPAHSGLRGVGGVVRAVDDQSAAVPVANPKPVTMSFRRSHGTPPECLAGVGQRARPAAIPSVWLREVAGPVSRVIDGAGVGTYGPDRRVGDDDLRVV